MRPRVVLLIVIALTLVAGVFVIPKAWGRITDRGNSVADGGTQSEQSKNEPAMLVQPAPPPTLRARPVTLQTNAPFWSWALMDRSTLDIQGSPNFNKTNTTESMIKAWLVSDFLRRADEKKQTPTAATLDRLSLAILDSNDNSAQFAYQQNGGNASIQRLIKTCALTDTKVHSGWWSLTQMSARDAVRMGACVADGRAAGKKWTPWVLEQMQHVRGGVADQQTKTGGGRWGIIDGLPPELAATVAIKNGWTPQGYDGRWHINCLAISEEWILAVQAQFPYGAWPAGAAVPNGLDQGAAICRDVTKALLTGGLAPQ